MARHIEAEMRKKPAPRLSLAETAESQAFLPRKIPAFCPCTRHGD
jgi:hypothetical protein